MNSRKASRAVIAAVIVCAAAMHEAHASWTLASGAQDASTTMTDGTATLKVVVLDAEARTLRLGNKAMTATSFAKDYPVTGSDKVWLLDFSMPITLAGETDPWTIVEVCPWAFCNTKNVYAPASGLDLTSVTNIGAGAFMYCQGFTKILLSSHLEEVGPSAFNQCFKNTEFVPQLPPSLKKVGHGAFAHHTKWDQANVMLLGGDLEMLGVEEIHASAFNWLPNITNVVVGSKLTTIDNVGGNYDSSVHGKSPFRGLCRLQTITFYGEAPSSLPALFLDDRYDANNAVQTDSSSTRTITCYLYEDYTNGWVTAMAATGGTIADYTDANNEKVFAKWTGGNGNRTVLLALLEGHPASDTEPQFNTAPTIEKSGSSLLFTGRLSEGRGALSAVFIETDGTTEHVFPLTSGNEVLGDADETAYTMTFNLSSGATGLPPNKTYMFAIRGSNSENEVVTKAGSGTFFFGEVDVSVNVAATSENGGSLTYTVSRAGTDGALTVPLAFSGTASEFANFREVPHVVAIPAGESSASFTVTPVVSLATSDTTLGIAADGAAHLFVGSTATATISDWEEPILSGFPNSTTFTAAGSSLAQANSLAHFPVLVRLPATLVAAIADSSNLAFFQDGNLLPHEVDTWSAEGGLVWVGMDALYTNAVVTCAWGKDGYVAPNLACDLWHEAGYVAVWHLGETAIGAVSVANSTVYGSALGGTCSSSTKANADGAIGAARTIADVRTNVGRITMPMPDAYLDLPTLFTASFWVWQDELGATNRAEYIAGSSPSVTDVTGWLFRKEAVTSNTETYYSKGLNSGGTPEPKPNFTSPSTNEWDFLSVSFDNTASQTYKMSRNGVVRAFTGHFIGSGDTPFVFGNVYQSGQAGLTGAMDEIRLRRVVSSEAWLKAETAAVKDVNFMHGEQEPYKRTMIIVW